MNEHSSLTFVALNEFNAQLLRDVAQQWNFVHLQKLLRWEHTVATIDDTYESDYLEPWVQWVSLHTGKNSKIHNVKHLGDLPPSKDRQIWETLSDHGVSSGIWSAMNAGKRDAKHCKFFVPDPWTFSEGAEPKELHRSLLLGRYMAKNYLKPSYVKVLGYLALFVWPVLCRPKILWKLFRQSSMLLKGFLNSGIKAYWAYTFAEYAQALLFLDYKKTTRSQFSMVFLNAVAHVQHYYWNSKLPLKDNYELYFAYYFMDQIFGEIFAEIPSDEEVWVCNGLTQRNTNADEPWVLYKLIRPDLFFTSLGLHVDRVEPLMSYDGHIFFKSEAECVRGQSILENVFVNGRPLFLVEKYLHSGTPHLFYRVQYYDELESSAEIVSDQQRMSFFEHLKKITVRTGKHVQKADLFRSRPYPNLPTEKLKNEQVHDLILRYFGLDVQRENALPGQRVEPNF